MYSETPPFEVSSDRFRPQPVNCHGQQDRHTSNRKFFHEGLKQSAHNSDVFEIIALNFSGSVAV
jgi:hypothetical protein